MVLSNVNVDVISKFCHVLLRNWFSETDMFRKQWKRHDLLGHSCHTLEYERL